MSDIAIIITLVMAIGSFTISGVLLAGIINNKDYLADIAKKIF